MELKIGDKITTNPNFKSFNGDDWWNEWKNKEMTIKEITCEKYIFIVYENDYWWPSKAIIKLPSYEFITEEEFSI